MVSETKIDDTFPESQSLTKGLSKPFRFNPTVNGGGILLYIRENIPCRYIKQITLNNSFEGFLVNLNLRSKKWLLGCPYNHHKDNTASHLSNVIAALDKLYKL